MYSSWISVLLTLIIGAAAGMLGGLVGIGGGVIVIPGLVFILGFSQHLAQGTSLAMMLPPIGILAVMAYYEKGFVDLPAAALLCIGFVSGSYLGAKMAVSISAPVLSRGFGVFLICIGARLALGK